MGKKYIIELESGTHIFVLGPEGIVHIGEPDVVYETVDGMQIGDAVINAKPYTEPDLEQVRKEAYEEGYKTAKIQCGIQAEKDMREVGERHYQRGLSDAWEAARKIGSNSMCSLKEIGFDFSRCAVADYNPSWFVVKNYSASECIEKIRKYEQEKDSEIKVGDEVELILNGEVDSKAVFLEDDEGYYRCLFWTGCCFTTLSYPKEKFRKTGRHFDEIATVLDKMRGEQDGRSKS